MVFIAPSTSRTSDILPSPHLPCPFPALLLPRFHFFFLDIWLGHMHLRAMCALIVSAMLPALLLPGLVHSRAPRSLVGLLLVVQVRLCGGGGLG